jgi:cell division septation protein DedD
MINNLLQRDYSNILTVLAWLLGAISLVCVYLITTASPRYQPQGAAEASIQPALQGLPLSISSVDLTTAQPFGNPASGPIARHDSEQANDATQQRDIASINDPEEASLAHGPWVIYLTSLRREEDAVKFIAKVQSQGVSAKTQAVTVKGDKYWRVYVPSFASANQARTNATVIKEKLGLDDYWVAKL